MEKIGSKTISGIVKDEELDGGAESIEDKPYVEVKVIPGFNSNQTMLGFDHDVEMLSETQI